MSVITQPFCEEWCRGWGQTTGAVHWLIISDGFEWSSEWDPSKKNRHYIDIQTKHHELIKGFFSTFLNEATLSFKIVSFNCLNQLQMTHKDLVFFPRLKESGWEKNCCSILLWWSMCECLPLYERVCVIYCKLNLLYNSSHLYSMQHICMNQCISCCAL